MNQALNIDDLERRIGVHDGLSIDEAMKLVARLRDLERELSIAKGNNAARIDGLQAAISVLEKRAQPAGEAVGQAVPMPGSDGGFTMACFEASNVPIGTKVYAAPPAAANHAGIPVDELAMMIRLLVHALRKAAPANPLSVRAMDYLERHGLQGSVLRAAPHTEPQKE